MSTPQQLTTFWLGGLYFGLEVEKVQEVLRQQELTRVPLAPDVVSGLANLRGQIVTVIGLRRRLGLPARTDGRTSASVIIREGDEIISLLVDEIGEVLAVDAENAEPPPPTLTGVGRDLIRCVHKLPGRLLLVLDASRAVDPPGDPNASN